MVERAPHPLLRGAVLRYAGYEERAATPVVRTELPQDRVSLIVNLGAPFAVAGERFGSFVAPVDDRPATTSFESTARGVQLDLQPFAARALLGVPLDELHGALAVDLGAVLGRDAAELEERLDAAPGWDARFALLDALLLRRLQRAAPPPDLLRAWSRLQATGGSVRIGSLAGELGCSRRHLAARFREHVGVPPKTVGRILRFRRAAALLRGGAGPAATAHACGYADQSHLNREFRALAGATPVTFLQDGAVTAT
ncbi:MAG TPA: helix-turn-helix transcriptional regulator [Solirubrobacteraceae bacterium]|nr:helix-turn-helix transcriptional regulator [Solirubrobacteraceae bacterium]